MKRNIFILNLVLLLAILVMDSFYIIFDGILLKSIASLLFVIVGLINLFYAYKLKANLKFPIILVVGLVFAMLGDIILEIHFITGALLFATGHIFFFVSYCAIVKFKVKDLIYGTIIFIPSMLLIVLAPFFEYPSLLMEIICVVYALIISLMVGKSISNLISEKNLTNLNIMLGSVLFFLSDLMLLLNVFAGLSVVGILCLVLYYPAEFLLAFSPFLYADKNNIEEK